MADKRIEYKIGVDSSDGVRGLRDFSRAAEKAGSDVEEAFDDTSSAADKAAAAIVQMGQKVDSELRETATAADALAQALGPELAAKVDTTRMVADFQKMGLTLQDIKGEADTLATALKQVDDIKMQGLRDGIDFSDTSMQRLRGSSDQTRSVMANLAGNAAQDLGALGGVVGTLGVGIGQLAEYAVDGNIALSNLTKLAGPMAGLALATAAVSEIIGGIKAEDAFNAEQVDSFTEAMREGGTAAEAIRDTVAETGELLLVQPTGGGFAGLGKDVENLIPLFNELGITYEIFMDLVNDPTAASRYVQMGQDIRSTNRDLSEDYFLIGDAIRTYQDNIDVATTSTEELNTFLGVGSSSVDEMNAAFEDFNDTASLTNTLWAAIVNDLADGNLETANAKDAWNQLARQLGLTDDQMSEIAAQKLDEKLQAEAAAAEEAAEKAREYAEALDEAGEAIADIRADLPDLGAELSAALDTADATVDFQGAKAGVDDAIDDLQTYIEEHEGIDWSALLDTSQIAPGDIDADMISVVQGVRDALQEGIVAAFEIGGAPAAQHFLDTFVPQLMEQGGLSEAEVYELLGIPADGTIDAVLQPIIDEAAAARAVDILDAIVGTGVQDARVAAIQIALERGDITGEIAEIAALLVAEELGIPVSLEGIPPEDVAAAQAYLDGNPVVYRTETDTAVTQQLLDEVADPRTAVVTADDEGTIEEVSGAADEATEDRELLVIVPKSPSLGQMQDLIDHVARARTVNFISKADNAGQIDGVLDGVAAQRYATITAFAQTNEAEYKLNYAARNRTADIYVVTHNSGGGGGGGGGGSLEDRSAPAPASVGLRGVAAPAAQPASTASTASSVVLAAPAPRPIVVNVNAAVIGSRYDVQRAVTRALRNAERLGATA